MESGQLVLIFVIGLVGSLAAIALWQLTPRVWRWTRARLAQQLKHALGIEDVNEKLKELDDTLLYVFRQQMEMDDRMAKLEQPTHNPNSPSSETEDKGS